MKLIYVMAAAAAALTAVAPAAAELPVPPMAAATSQADAYLFHGAAGDVYEVTSSMMAVHNAANPDVRAFATMLIAGHTGLTNTALATARGAGVAAPPPILSPMQMGLISQLVAAGPNFDRVYLQQQLTAHQQALAMQSGYVSGGDVPALRQAAAGAVPIVQGHIARIQQMMAGM